MINYFHIIYNAAPKGESSEGCGQSFDLTNACKICGTGAQFIGNTYTKGIEKIDHDFFETLDGDYIISHKLYTLLIGHYKIKLGDTLQTVNSRKKFIPFYHIKPFMKLPKANKLEGIEIDKGRRCNTCLRESYYNILIKDPLGNKVGSTAFIYSTNIFKQISQGQHDILQSWEYFGESTLSVPATKKPLFARPALLISGKLRDAFEELKLKNIKYNGQAMFL